MWGEGDHAWGESLERFMGSVLMGFRGWKVWLLQYGVANAGKGTATNGVLKRLMAGGFMGIRAETVLEKHMEASLVGEDVLVLSDVGEMEERDMRKLAGLLRTVLGQDDITAKRKVKEAVRGVVLRCAPIVQSHYLLSLPNEQGGLSAKMIPLHYRVGMTGRMDLGFGDKLAGELEGIAVRLCEAAVRLVGAAEGERWPITEGSQELKRRVEIEGNPVDSFLDWGFVRREDGWVSGEMLKQVRREWEKKGMGRIRKGSGAWVPDNGLLSRIEDTTAWGLRRVKSQGSGVWGLRGLVMKTARE